MLQTEVCLSVNHIVVHNTLVVKPSQTPESNRNNHCYSAWIFPPNMVVWRLFAAEKFIYTSVTCGSLVKKFGGHFIDMLVIVSSIM